MILEQAFSWQTLGLISIITFISLHSVLHGAIVCPLPDSRSLRAKKKCALLSLQCAAWCLTDAGHHKCIFVLGHEGMKVPIQELPFSLSQCKWGKNHILIASYHWFQYQAQRCWKYSINCLLIWTKLKKLLTWQTLRGSSITFGLHLSIKIPPLWALLPPLNNMPQFQNDAFEINPVWVMFLLDS